jgi:hypothetical protein
MLIFLSKVVFWYSNFPEKPIMELLLSQHHRFPREGKSFKGSSTTSTHGLQATLQGVAFFLGGFGRCGGVQWPWATDSPALRRYTVPQ